MTTNSPNPVDGDVQALSAFLKEKVASLKLAVKQSAFENVRDELVMELKSAEISLAALEAEPVADVVAWSHPEEERKCAVHLRKFDLMPGRLYTIPPANLLRPVVLPKPINTHDLHGKTDYFYDRSEGWNSAIYECAESLRQQGYEVKND